MRFVWVGMYITLPLILQTRMFQIRLFFQTNSTYVQCTYTNTNNAVHSLCVSWFLCLSSYLIFMYWNVLFCFPSGVSMAIPRRAFHFCAFFFFLCSVELIYSYVLFPFCALNFLFEYSTVLCISKCIFWNRHSALLLCICIPKSIKH